MLRPKICMSGQRVYFGIAKDLPLNCNGTLNYNKNLSKAISKRFNKPMPYHTIFSVEFTVLWFLFLYIVI